MSWVPTWTQAMTHFRGEDDKPPFDDVTVRMTVPASVAGGRVRVELSNRFGDEPIRIAERRKVGRSRPGCACPQEEQPFVWSH